MPEHDPARTLVFHPTARSVVYFGAFQFDLADGLVWRAGEEIRLPPRALVILQHLVERAGRVVPKQALIDAAWKDAYVSETSLTEAIGLIRQALGDDPQNPSFIQTVHRRGYRFIAPITTEAPAAPAAAPERARAAAPAPARATAPEADETQRWLMTLWIVPAVLLAIGAAAVTWFAFQRSPAQPTVRLSLALTPEQAPAPGLNAHPVATISPDGQRIVYAGGTPEASRLFVRRIDQFEAAAIPGTDGAHGPFFSPDGQWVGFFANGGVRKLRLDTGESQMLCATPTGVGGAWLSRDEIVFAPDWTGPLMRVAASGGQASVLAAPAQGFSYRWPDRIDDRTVIATRWRSNARDAALVSISLPSGAEQVIAERAVFGRYLSPGAVAFVQDGDVYAVRLDASTRRPRGTPIRVVPAVLTGMTGAAQFAVSPSGTMLYIGDIEERARRVLARVDAQGKTTDLPIAPRPFRTFELCGDRIAAIVQEHGEADLWAGRLDTPALTRITQEGSTTEPIWSPDCRTIAFGWNRTGVMNIATAQIDSGDPPELFMDSRVTQFPGSWSADGRWFAYVQYTRDARGDIWLRDGHTGRARPLLATPAYELVPRLSPDARWVAYESDATGRFEIEIATVARGSRVQVSAGGGIWPSWSADGRSLYFLHDRTVERVAVSEHDGVIAAGPPQAVFSHPDILTFRLAGDQLVWLRRTAEHLPLTRLNLVLGWFSELDQRVP